MSLISESHNFIFIHIPKNAGSSIRKALNKYARPFLYEHEKAESIKCHIGTKFYDYFRFAVIRNPWARLASMYNYLLNIGSNQVKNKTFKDYLRINCENPDTQYSYIFGREGIYVDFLLRFENLQNDFDSLCKTLSMAAELPLINYSNINSYEKMYDVQSIEQVQSAYMDDIKNFGYAFEDGLNTNAAAKGINNGQESYKRPD